jgi:hypothetical protein
MYVLLIIILSVAISVYFYLLKAKKANPKTTTKNEYNVIKYNIFEQDLSRRLGFNIKEKNSICLSIHMVLIKSI